MAGHVNGVFRGFLPLPLDVVFCFLDLYESFFSVEGVSNHRVIISFH